MARRKFTIAGETIRPGETRDVRIKISETYTGDRIEIPVRVIRAKKPGPRLFLTAAIHGDEINGTGIIREFLFGKPVELKAGTLVCVPVVNIFGFESGERYLPDRRDLNRSFPGSMRGSLASRIAATLYEEIIENCEYGIDLHSAADQRTNFPNVRADLSRPEVKRLAQAFGAELIIHGKGPEGAFRRAACEAGVATIILEAGEPNKIEPTVLETGMRGIDNVLIDLGMMDGERARPLYQITVRKSHWVRAELGGLLRFHVAPGDFVNAGEALATNESVFGEQRLVLIAPQDGIVLGMATNPAVKPGEPVYHLAYPRRSLRAVRRAIAQAPPDSLYLRTHAALRTNIVVSENTLVVPIGVG